jgi:enterobacterial common antigen flippase
MKTPNTSYKQIARSTGIFGGSQLGIMILGVVRTKILAILLGPAGIGLAGLLQSIIDLMRSITGLGLGFSSVKDIADASDSNNEIRMAQTNTMLKRWLWGTGIAGMLLTILFSPLISRFTFKDNSQTLSICLLSVCVLIGSFSTGQLAILQGMRRITWMAKASLYGATGSFLAVIPLYYFMGVRGIVPALILIHGITFFFSWTFSRKICLPSVRQTWSETWTKGKNMVVLGFYTVLAGLAATLTLFLIRSYIVRVEGNDAVGLFQAVWSISNVYVGAILTSMAADYYPRLCRCSTDNLKTIRFTNEQIRFVLILTTPLLMLLQLLAGPVLHILYSDDFSGATTLLRLQLLGTFLKIAVWPIGFILLAKGKGLLFLMVELFWHIVYFASTVLLWPYAGLNATGIGYLLAYAAYLPLVYFVVRPLCHFHLTGRNVILMLGLTTLMLSAFWTTVKTDGFVFWLFGCFFLMVTSLWSLYEMNRILPVSEWKSMLLKLLKR